MTLTAMTVQYDVLILCEVHVKVVKKSALHRKLVCPEIE